MIYHVFPGNNLHHVPDMIHILVRYAHALGISTAEQVFYVCGTTDNLRDKYECPGLPADRLTHFLDHYEDYLYIAQNAVEWATANMDRMLFGDFESLIHEITGRRFPKRLID